MLQDKTIKFFGVTAVVLAALNIYIFYKLEQSSGFFGLMISAFILFLLFVFISFEKNSLRKTNAGLFSVLEKSEQSRILAEKIKHEVLSFIDDFPDGFLVIDKNDNILFANKASEKILGVSRKNVFKRPAEDLKYFSKEQKLVAPLLESLKYGTAVQNLGLIKEDVRLRKDYIFELAIEHLTLSDNSRARLVVLRNIARAREIQDSHRLFISTVAHQLKTPLANTKLSLKMLLDNEFGKISKKQQDILEKTYENNELLISLVEDFLQQAKEEEQGEPVHLSDVDLQQLTKNMAKFYEAEMEIKKINYKFNAPDKKIFVKANVKEIKNVVQNLFDNAVKYTLRGGKIEVNIIPRKKEVEFQIKDSGVGIPENQKDKIFKRFVRGGNVNKTNGSGLGLAISKDIIEKHKGKIWFRSKENKGSMFFFTLPFKTDGDIIKSRK